MALTDLRDLLPGIAAREAADAEAYPSETIVALYRAAIPSAPFARGLGGEGCSLPDAVAAIELLATASPSAALIAAMPLGLAGCLQAPDDVVPEGHCSGWHEQVRFVGGEFRAGKLYAACNSEKGAGGSLANTKTMAKGMEGRFTLTGEKILASGGRNAAYFLSTAKVPPEDLPGTGVVEFFLVETRAPGVTVLDDWDGFGMRSTESHSVRYESAPAHSLLGFANFIDLVQPVGYWYCLFAAIPLGCARAILRTLGEPAPSSPALRLRLAEARMRYEALRAYLLETASLFCFAGGPQLAARVARTKTYVTQESTRISAELFALSGGSQYRRTSRVARMLADSFAGTALRPPLPLGLEAAVEGFSVADL